MTRIPQALRQRVRDRAQGRCEYCQSSERLTGLSCEIDHILPRVLGGLTTDDNLCLACAACNGYKGAITHTVDPESDEEVALFDPRRQNWREHFAWSEDGTLVVGLTACGRATVVTMKLNQALTIAARSIWASVGQHPPKE
jgi:hypothetical protein